MRKNINLSQFSFREVSVNKKTQIATAPEMSNRVTVITSIKAK